MLQAYQTRLAKVSIQAVLYKYTNLTVREG